MILLSLIAVGILSLSSTVLRSTNNSRGQSEARNNARLALTLAIAKLQKLAGPDTRVTAPADAMAGNSNASPYVTGVWRSWEGLDHDSSTGLPFAPNYDNKKETNNSNDGRFLGWLVSSSQAGDEATSPPSVSQNAGGESTVPLLAEGTTGEAGTGREVHLEPTEIGDSGSYAWWIQGENSKALVAKPWDEPETDRDWGQRLLTNGRPDLSEFGFRDPEDLAVLPTRKTMDLARREGGGGTKVAERYFHDVTANANGLLTNTATGGWRRDLSLMSEQWQQQPSSNLPFFHLGAGSRNGGFEKF